MGSGGGAAAAPEGRRANGWCWVAVRQEANAKTAKKSTIASAFRNQLSP